METGTISFILVTKFKFLPDLLLSFYGKKITLHQQNCVKQSFDILEAPKHRYRLE